MADSKTPKPEIKLTVVTSTLELLVTPEMLAQIERKRRRRKNRMLLGEELHAKECGEVDLGEIEE